MGGSSSQRRKDLTVIFRLFSRKHRLLERTHESLVEKVATAPPKTKKPTRARQKRMIQSDDAPRQIARVEPPTKITLIRLIHSQVETGNTFKHQSEGGSKRHKSSGFSSFNTESGDASINLNTNAGKNDEDEVHEIRRTMDRDKARAAKNKGSKASGSSTMNDDALARLMVTEMTTQEKEERLTFTEIKRREVECRELEVAAQDYQARQEDIRFYLQPYDYLTRDQRMAMDKARATIKAKYNLQY
nr:hypothetical protein [Tanacetum cinerariifolium]